MKIKEESAKKFPKYTALLLCVLSLLSWPCVYLCIEAEEQEYSALISEADRLIEDKIYTGAAELLEKAAETKEDYETCMKLASCYLGLGEAEDMLNSCASAIALDPAREDAYLLLVSYYTDKKNYSTAYETAEAAKLSGCTSAALDEKIKELDSVFVKSYLAADSVGDWFPAGTHSYAVFERNGKYGLLRSDGHVSLAAEYEYLGAYSAETGTLPARQDGEICWIDTDGNRRLLAECEISSAGTFASGHAAVFLGDSWGYVGTDGKTELDGFEYCGTFASGVAAVKKNGKWALMDSKLCSLTGFDFDDILLDSNGCCAAYGLCVTVKDGVYYLTSLKGSFISGGYEFMALPASDDGYIAACRRGKWGFVGRDGEIVLEPRFDGAESFSLGMAPVTDGEISYYIGTDGVRINSEEYTEAGTFSCEGRAVVRSGSFMKIIAQCRFE